MRTPFLLPNKRGTLFSLSRLFANAYRQPRVRVGGIIAMPENNSATGTRTRVARVRAEYPNQLDYSGACCKQNIISQRRGYNVPSLCTHVEFAFYFFHVVPYSTMTTYRRRQTPCDLLGCLHICYRRCCCEDVLVHRWMSIC